MYDWHYVPKKLDKQQWRRFFVKVKNDKRVAHLHLMQEGQKRWGEQLIFRDTSCGSICCTQKTVSTRI